MVARGNHEHLVADSPPAAAETSSPVGADLFRRAALKADRQAALGSPLQLGAPRDTLAALLAVLVTFALLAGLLGAEYRPRTTVAGRITAGEGVAGVTAHRNATVAAIEAREGASVTKGDVLLVLADPAGALDLGARLREELLQQEARIGALTELGRAERDRSSGQLTAALAATDHRLHAARARARLLAERSALLEQSHARMRVLVRDGYLESARLDTARIELLDARLETARLAEHILDLEDVRRRQQDELDDLDSGFERSRSELALRRHQITRERLRTEAMLSSLVRAPISGRVGFLGVRTGQSVTPGELLANIIPAGSELGIQLLVPSAAAASLAPGQEVRLRYDALPARHYGSFPGRVRQVSEVPVRQYHGSAQPGSPLVLFRVEVSPEHPLPAPAVPTRKLLPGSTLEAEILDVPRRLWQRLFDPLRERGL